MQITEEQILKIVDKCFHSYASSFRNEAREEAINLINKHKEAITVTPCCTELKADKKEPTFEEWVYMNNYTPKVKKYIDENSIVWTEHELINMYNEEVMSI